MSKLCIKCKIVKRLSDFYPYKKNVCKKCYVNNAVNYQKKFGNRYIKKYHQSPKGKKALNEASDRSYVNHKERWVSRAKAHYAIKKGIIKKPRKCEVCEKKCSGHALQAHHEDYTKPLEVIFLCYSCHAEADKLLEIRNKQKI